jgi:DNA repair exonuclease SbcCD nuclease subunit
MLCSELNVAVVSDIHLGNKRNETEHIVGNLYSELPNDVQMAGLDILFLAGDVFDTLLNYPDNVITSIDTWITDLLRSCHKHSVKLRVLEGTPSHDRNQSQRFEIMNKLARIGADLKYIKDLSIEYFPEYDINVLYVPDEWNDSAQKTYDEVQALLENKCLQQVDFAVMHGQFEYQMPAHIRSTATHSSDAYSELVKYLIFIGHIHTHSRYGKIVAQGSFDRMAQGEEEPKGYVMARLFKDGNYELKFVENKGARRFVTIDCTGLGLDATINRINERACLLPNKSFIRIKGDKDNALFTNMDQLVQMYPLMSWSALVNEVEVEVPSGGSGELEEVYVPVTITSDNITKLVTDKLVSRSVTSAVLSNVEAILQRMR